MEQSLGLAAAQLPSPTLSTNTAIQVSSDIFAKNTSDAIYSGAVLAIVGAITLMAHELNKRCTHKPNIIISGGNAKTIYDTLVLSVTNPVLIVDNLVLQGLFLLESATPINFVQSESQ